MDQATEISNRIEKQRIAFWEKVYCAVIGGLAVNEFDEDAASELAGLMADKAMMQWRNAWGEWTHYEKL